MKNRLSRCCHALGLWLLCLAISGCSSMGQAAGKPCFACDEQRLVRIVPFTQGAASYQRRAQHPLVLERQEWEALLRAVKVRSVHSPLLGASYRGDTEPVFSEEEVGYLGESLRRAFQQVTEQEQVVFAVARPSDAGLDQVTSGAWFVEAGNFHLRLANCRVAVTLPSIRRQIWKDPLFTQAGALYELVPGDRQALVPTSSDGLSLFRSDQPELVIDYAGRREEAAPAAPAATATPPSAATVEERLAILKRLYEQGLITDEDYRLKKQQLLDRL